MGFSFQCTITPPKGLVNLTDLILYREDFFDHGVGWWGVCAGGFVWG
jgi:hypothetical protein